MTERVDLDDGDLDGLHCGTLMSLESGFGSVQCDARVMLALIAEVKASRAVIPMPTPQTNPTDEKLLDELCAKRAAGLGERSMRGEPAWVLCSERMPEEGRAVLFCNLFWAEPELGRFVDDGWELDDETRYTQDEVQFWHALPAPPEAT